MFDRMIHWSLHNRLFVIVGSIALLVFGMMTARRMPLDVFPEFAPPQVVIQTSAPGFSTEDVETLVTFPIESAINGTPKVEKLRSQSMGGLSNVIVIFESGTDVYLARQLVNEKLQLVGDGFPPGVRPPVMLPVTSAIGLLDRYILTAEENSNISLMDLRTFSEWDIRRRLLAESGIASVVSQGGELKQYQVLVSSERLRNFNLTLGQVVEAVEGTNMNVPGGFLQSSDEEFVITGKGRIRSLEDIRKAVIAVVNGAPITLAQIAEVKFGPAIKRGDAGFLGKPAVSGSVTRIYGADTLATTYKMDRAMEDIEKRLPEGMVLKRGMLRQAHFIETTIKQLKSALIEGGVIVTIILLLFLFSLRASFISFLAMPMSLLTGVLVLRYFGISINAMTLGGLTISIGEVVDDAIIDVENVFRRLRENRKKPAPEDPLDVVFKASREIRNSIVYATFIVGLVFLPIFFLPGLEGKIFAPLAIAYLAALLASLLVALTQTPVLCYLFLARSSKPPEEEKESMTVVWLKRHYRRVLNLTLTHPKWVIGISAMMLVVALAILPFFGRSFLPEFNEGNLVITMTFLPGTSLDESMRVAKRVEALITRHPEVVSVSYRSGMAELDEDILPVNVTEFETRINYEGGRDPDEIKRAIREDLSQFKGVGVSVGGFIAHRIDEILSGVRAQIAIKIFGPDLDILREKGRQVRDMMATIAGVTDLQLEQQRSVPGVSITFDREAAARHGLKIEDLARYVEAINGITVSQVVEGMRTFDLVVRSAESDRTDLRALQNILIDTPSGAKIPLREVAMVEVEEAPYIINRDNVMRRIAVQSNVQGRDLNSVIREAKEKIQREVRLPQGYFIEYGGQFESQEQAQKIMISLGLASFFGIFLMLYQALNSLRAAVIVMASLPLALIGGVVAVALSGWNISVSSMVGFVALFGIASRNGIILMTHYRYLMEEEGMPYEEALIQGSLDRLIPVLMTAGTAGLGLLPIVFGSPIGKELERPLAQVILGGLVSSTFLDLILMRTLCKLFGLGKEYQTRPKEERTAAFPAPAGRMEETFPEA